MTPSTHLAHLPPSLRQLAGAGVTRRFPRRTRFIAEGDVGTSIYVILSGRVKVFTSDDEGKEFVFGTYDSGAILGEMALDGLPRSASAEALTDVQCAIVPIDVLRRQIAEDPDFTMELIRTLIARSRNTTTFSRRLALENAYQRLAALLDGLAVEQDGVRSVPEPLSQQDLAHRIGTSRDMVSKLFKELVKGEYLLHQNKRITLLRPLPAKW
ncbi:Crp/Fnr family transcriptional regulator [Massilia sp. YIM B02769]|uniref:Crp/Fnr family transcriptional regulator n=1 Tax=unclassified Massilia TaxID=2609279 RepID=UPI0025B650C3|nr:MULTISPECIES: Crp/Fnr family transcriptional regulator [unclassified Massilia]MDN4059929.1 Crp/Fnr family transcriptional regulator [Massilia sp. YIM B02769]